MNEGPESINPLDRLIAAYESDKTGFASTSRDAGGRRGRCFNDANKFDQRINSTAEFGPNAKEFSEVTVNAMFQGKDPLFSLPPYSTEVTENIMGLLAKLDKDLTGDSNGTEIEQQQATKWNAFWDKVKTENNLSDANILQFQYDFITSYRYQALEKAKINGMVVEADNPIANAWRKIEDYLVVVSMRYRDPKSSPQQVYDAFFKTFKIKNKGEVDDRIGNIVAAVKANDMNKIEHEIDVLMTTKMVKTFGKVVVDEALNDLFSKLKQEGLFTPEIEAVVNNKMAKIRDMEILAKMIGTPETPITLKQAEQIYQHFAKPEQSKENVDFLLALGKLGDPPQRAEVEVIINQFMREDSPQFLNLDIRKQKELIAKFEKSTDVNLNLFRDAKVQVLQMVRFNEGFKQILAQKDQEPVKENAQAKKPEKSGSPPSSPEKRTLRGMLGIKDRTPSPETTSPPKSPRSPRNPLSLASTISKRIGELAQSRNAKLEKIEQDSPPPSPRQESSPANLDERNRAKVAQLLGPEAVRLQVIASIFTKLTGNDIPADKAKEIELNLRYDRNLDFLIAMADLGDPINNQKLKQIMNEFVTDPSGAPREALNVGQEGKYHLPEVERLNSKWDGRGEPSKELIESINILRNVVEEKCTRLMGMTLVNPSVIEQPQRQSQRQPEPTPPESPPLSNPSSPRPSFGAVPSVDNKGTILMGSGRTSPQTVQTQSLEQREQEIRHTKPLPSRPPNKAPPQFPNDLGPTNTFTPSFAGRNPLLIRNHQEPTVSLGQAWSNHIKDLKVSDFKYPDRILFTLLKGAVERMDDAQKNGKDFANALNTEMKDHINHFSERAVEAMKVVNAIIEGISPTEMLARQSQREPESAISRKPR